MNILRGKNSIRNFLQGARRNNSLRIVIQALILLIFLQQIQVYLHEGQSSSTTSIGDRDERSTSSVLGQEHNVLALLDDFKKAHNADRLAADPNHDRVFVVGHYSCPYQAGNRLFHFLNAFVHAVVLDKPLLWKYCTSNKVCPRHGEVEDCDPILNRAKWIPSWETYGRQLKTELLWGTNRHLHRENIFSGPEWQIPLDEMRHATKVVLETGILEGPKLSLWLTEPDIRKDNILSPAAYQRAKTLFSAGTDFAYGALFHAAFQIDPSLLPDQEMVSKLGHSTSMAIHSRHQKKLDQGNDTSTEEFCLNKAYEMSGKQTSWSLSPTPCTIVLMSDRSMTLEGLQQKRPSGCQTVMASHQKGQSFVSEHGEFAGAGFFQDLALAQHAQHAVVLTYHSSASDLIRCVWRYQRFLSSTKGNIAACTIRDPNGTQCDCKSETIGG